jgi:leucyl/phenylalanyl-tRNA--protein transferase
MSITWLDPNQIELFPPLSEANEDGLLAAGGDLSCERLVAAYRRGIFPWFNKHDPILWWSPNPRMVLFTDEVKISKSLNKTLRQTEIKVSFDQAFSDVVNACAAPRASQSLDPENSTWIHPDMKLAYQLLHEAGHAHSVECWQNGELVGGLYGVAIGKMFFGESMFSRVRDSSKIALVSLCQQLQRWDYPMIDCQIYSDHLASLGACEIDRGEFCQILDNVCEQAAHSPWQLDEDLPKAL